MFFLVNRSKTSAMKNPKNSIACEHNSCYREILRHRSNLCQKLHFSTINSIEEHLKTMIVILISTEKWFVMNELRIIHSLLMLQVYSSQNFEMEFIYFNPKQPERALFTNYP